MAHSNRIIEFHELFQVPIILFYLSSKEESLLYKNYFYCKKVATRVFLNGLVLLIRGIVKFTFKRLEEITITES